MNEEADKIAKKAAKEQKNVRLTPMSLSVLLQETRTLFHPRTAGFDTGKQQLKTQPRRVADALAQLEKGEAATIFHFRSGHSPLNEY